MKTLPEDGLFRSEALDAMTDRRGAPLGGPGLGNWILTGFIGLILLTLAIFLSVGQYSRKETVIGQLVPPAGAVRITSVRPGVATQVFVKEGDTVKAGQPILRISYDETTEDGGSLGALLLRAADAEASASAAQSAAELSELGQQRAELVVKRSALQQEQRRLATDIALQGQRLKLLEETVTATRTLFDKNLISAVQMRQREEALLAARQSLNTAEGNQESNLSGIAQLDIQISRIGSQISAQQASSSVAVARLESGRAQLASEASGLVLARRSGTVAALQAREGAPVAANATLAMVFGSGDGLSAELWVPSRAIGFIRPGNQVRLMFDAFPYQRFGVGKGAVTEVGSAPVLPNELPFPVQTNESLYRVVVRVDRANVAAYGQDWRLSPGMRLTADIVLEERPLLAWIFEPILAIRERAK